MVHKNVFAVVVIKIMIQILPVSISGYRAERLRLKNYATHLMKESSELYL